MIPGPERSIEDDQNYDLNAICRSAIPKARISSCPSSHYQSVEDDVSRDFENEIVSIDRRLKLETLV